MSAALAAYVPTSASTGKETLRFRRFLGHPPSYNCVFIRWLTSRETQNAGPMLVKCWASVADAGPAYNRRRVHVSRALRWPQNCHRDSRLYLPCKVKRQDLLTLHVSRYRVLALKDRSIYHAHAHAQSVDCR